MGGTWKEPQERETQEDTASGVTKAKTLLRSFDQMIATAVRERERKEWLESRGKFQRRI